MTAAADPDHEAKWKEHAKDIRSDLRKSMLATLEERGFVKDIAGGRQALDWLLTEKSIGAYVGVDPTAPSLHVGHLLPLMALYWMYLHGFRAVTLIGGGTVQIGDPSGRTTARARQSAQVHNVNIKSMSRQLKQLWTHVNVLGTKHHHAVGLGRHKKLLNNHDWLNNLTAVDLMKTLGSGMRLGSMLSRDSVKLRMESGDGMAISEFCYPLFQGYDWWHMYSTHGVQLQLGGSDQYGNICAGMDAVDHMRRYHGGENESQANSLDATFGLTTPLLTTATGEKFGKSAGNAVWLDRDMLNSFDLYQYFLRTSDDDVERYLKLFTFLPIEAITLVMAQHRIEASKRSAQHLLAKEVVELAHGAEAAKDAETAHKHAFGHGTNVYSLFALRNILHPNKDQKANAARIPHRKDHDGGQTGLQQSLTTTAKNTRKGDAAADIVVLPSALLQRGTFPQILYAAGLVSSKSEAHRLIKSKGAYVVLPNSGTIDSPYDLKWDTIPASVQEVDPNHYLVDYEALVLRSGKTKIQICQIIDTEQFEASGQICPGWEDFKARQTATPNA